MSISTPTLIIFVIYIAAMVLINLAAYRSTNNFSDYVLGGRGPGSFVTALPAGASDMSGWLLTGLPDAVRLSSLSENWVIIGLTVGAYLNQLFVTGRLRVQTEHNGNALVLPDYFTNCFEDSSCLLRIFSALVILVFFTIYCASGTVADARLFESTSDLPYETTLQAGAAATITHTFIGSFLAVSRTDTVQTSLMIFVLILTPVIVILATGGIEPTFAVIELKDVTSFDMLKDISFIGMISLMTWSLGYFGQPHVLVCFMAADSVKSIPAACRIPVTWMILCLGDAVVVSFFGIACSRAHPEQTGAVSNSPERAFIELAKILSNPWVAGVLLSAIFTVIMSTLSCQLLVCFSAPTEGSYKVSLCKGASQLELVWVGHAMMLLVATIAIWPAANPEDRMLDLVSYAWADSGTAFGPLVLFSLLWKRMTRNGALTGMIIGAVTVILQKSLLGRTGLYGTIPGFLSASVAIVVFSLFNKTPSTSMLERFNDAEQEYRETHQGSATLVAQR